MSAKPDLTSSIATWTARLAIIAATLAAPAPAVAQDLHVEGLRTEYLQNPIGIDVRTPRLSWRIHSDRRRTMQSAYEIRVGAWSSGRVASSASFLRPYTGPVQPSTRYQWQVRVWDDEGKASPWSAPAFFETGLAEWKAGWITPDLVEDTTRSNPSPILRREFTLAPRVIQARLYITSLGLYEAEINGRRVGDALFRPGWTAYDHRLQYDTYDVTALVEPGANAIGVTLGDGWYRGRLGFEGKRNTYGTRLALLAQLNIRYADGSTQIITTDSSWKSSTGPIVASDIYDGETYDARLEKPTNWRGVRTINVNVTLVGPVGPPVRRMREIKPVRMIRTPNGDTVFDLGQNMVGWVLLRVNAPRGTTIRLRHAESLDKNGNFYTANLRDARQTVTYITKGTGVETYEPHFTFQGFRYVAIDGYREAAITGIVLHSDLAETGTFESSNALVNRLQQNIQWGQRGNFLDVPTDCPQRDERLGWTGDAQVFSPTAAFNMDVSGFFAKWLGDVALDQKPNGMVPWVIPDAIGRNRQDYGGSAGWSDVAVIVPWTMYRAYGDTSFLTRQYPSMRAWVEYERKQAGDGLLWTQGFHFGDWLAFATNRADYPGATTDKDLIATAYYAHSTDLLARSAAVLGRNDDAKMYRDLFARIRAAFQREYVTATGRLTSNTQTAYVLALDFGLLPDSLRADAARRLADDVRRMGHLTTGFLGTPALLRMLSDNGYLEVAYGLLLREQYPSWLYEVKQGATTIWERWDGLRPDSSFQDAGMNSFNHYAYGAVGDWLYRVVAGLNDDPDEPGYKHIIIRPRPGPGFTFAKATLLTPYGEAASGWRLVGDTVTVSARIPANTHATVILPDGSRQEIGSGDYEFKWRQ